MNRIGLTRLVVCLGRKTLITVSIGTAVAGLVAWPFVSLWGAVAVMVALGVGLGIPQPLTHWRAPSASQVSSGATRLSFWARLAS